MFKTTLEASTLDQEWKALGEPIISVIKMDIEGAELFALRGGQGLLSAMKPYVFIEWNSTNLKAYGCASESLLDFSVDNGYQLLSLPALVPMSNKHLIEVQMQLTESFILVPV